MMNEKKNNNQIEERYFKEIGKYPVLTRKEEIALARKAGAGDEEARKKLILSNLKLVIAIAKSYSSYGVPFLDLVEEGNLGLIKAVSRFDPEKGFRFSTYSSWWIKQSIVRAISDYSRTIRIPIHIFHAMKNYVKMEKKIKNLSSEEKAVQLDVSIKRVKMIEDLIQSIRALDVASSLDSYSRLKTNEEIPDSNDMESIILQQIEHEELEKLLDRLSEREKLIIRVRYGLSDGEPHTLAETGKVINVSRERVRQLEMRALKRLRCLLEAANESEEKLCEGK